MIIRFNKPYTTGRELAFVSDVIERGRLAGGGVYMDRCQDWLKKATGANDVLLTHSCTGALEIAMLVADLQPGDEVIMPSFTFTSTATSVVLQGATPVFVDVRPDTLNLDETLLEDAVTEKTRAIIPVHYAGVACDMEHVLNVARRHNLWVIEDAAQGMLASWKGHHLGSIGHMGAISFHETKNIQCGEGGALLLNDTSLLERAEIICDKGTNRGAFERREVDKYTWIDVGSSYRPSELTCAFLFAQLQAAEEITGRRVAVWGDYHQALGPFEEAGRLRRPKVPGECAGNGHIYYILLNTAAEQRQLLCAFKEAEIGAVFHYVPLHSAPAGRKLGRPAGSMQYTEDLSERLIRLPIWPDLESVEPVVSVIRKYFE